MPHIVRDGSFEVSLIAFEPDSGICDAIKNRHEIDTLVVKLVSLW